jgi:DNA-binding PadR family transcriptional regulator
MTLAVATVLSVFLDNPAQVRYGYDLMRDTGFASGKLYPVLARLEAVEWLERLPPTESRQGPPRVPYRLTALGQRRAEEALASIGAALTPRARSTRTPAVRPAFGST